MKRLAFILIAAVILLTGCSIGGTGNSASYHQIKRRKSWRIWDIPTSTNSAVSIHGTARLKSSRKNLKRQSCSFKNGTAVQYLRCINKECRWALSPPLAKFRLPVKFINGGSGFALHKDSAPEKSGAPCQG